MEDKSLRSKAVDIRGKEYVLVQDRVLFFLQEYINPEIHTKLLSSPQDSRVVVKAFVSYYEDKSGHRLTFTGHSQAVVGEGMVNKTAALENAETSAVGRALGFMGIGVIESIASADEMVKATAPSKPVAKPKPPTHIAKARDAAAKRIAVLLEGLYGVPFMMKQEYAEACLELTGLELKDENFSQIEAKLEELKLQQ